MAASKDNLPWILGYRPNLDKSLHIEEVTNEAQLQVWLSAIWDLSKENLGLSNNIEENDIIAARFKAALVLHVQALHESRAAWIIRFHSFFTNLLIDYTDLINETASLLLHDTANSRNEFNKAVTVPFSKLIEALSKMYFSVDTGINDEFIKNQINRLSNIVELAIQEVNIARINETEDGPYQSAAGVCGKKFKMIADEILNCKSQLGSASLLSATKDHAIFFDIEKLESALVGFREKEKEASANVYSISRLNTRYQNEIKQLHADSIEIYKAHISNVRDTNKYLQNILKANKQFSDCYGHAFSAFKSDHESLIKSIIAEVMIYKIRRPKAQFLVTKFLSSQLIPFANEFFKNNGIDCVLTSETFAAHFRELKRIPLSVTEILVEAYDILHSPDQNLRQNSNEQEMKDRGMLQSAANPLVKPNETISGSISMKSVKLLASELAQADKYLKAFSGYERGIYRPRPNETFSRGGAVLLFKELLNNAKTIEEIAALMHVAEQFVNRHRNIITDLVFHVHSTNTWKTAIHSAQERAVVVLDDTMSKDDHPDAKRLEEYEKKLPLFFMQTSQSLFRSASTPTVSQAAVQKHIAQLNKK